MLFVLYAESRGLLDVSNETYNRTFSFNSVKREVAETIDRGRELHSWHKQYWNRLKNLFSLINEGSESRGIPKEALFVPPYNGSLFNPIKHEFLERCAVGDSYLARVIDLLSRSNGGFIDYSTLDIRHLGSIYEGLLEFKLKIAEGDMVSIREKGKEVWVPRDEAGGKEIHEEVEEGGLYLVTDRGERKATGSYYTPGYIVKYIVGNSLGPIVEQKIEKARENGGKESEAVLSIKVLDPAMGSGHFLVEAVDYLARALLEAVGNDVEKGLLPEAEYSTEWAKREVVSHCIYGVDLNPLAVELAKLSLWLATIAKDKPLSFLDHRLKCGNSLIGTSLEDLPWHPKKGKQDRKQTRIDISGFVRILVDTVKKISEISDETLDDIKRKEKIFSEIKEKLAYKMIKDLADMHVSIYFGNDVDEKTYGDYSGDAGFSQSEEEWERKQSKRVYRSFVQKAEEMAKEKRFFHWELEFPEVFFEKAGPKEIPGFDAVVGNPPYQFGENIPTDVRTISHLFDFAIGQYDTYWLFYEIIMKRLLRGYGYHGFIIPDAVLARDEVEILRREICQKYQIARIAHVGPVFEDPNVSSAIIIWGKSRPSTIRVNISRREGEKIIPSFYADQQVFMKIPGCRWLVYLSEQELKILSKVFGSSIILGRLVEISRGEELGKSILLDPSESGEPILIGEDVGPLNYPLPSKKIPATFVKKDMSIYSPPPKIVFVKTGQRIVATIDYKGFITLQSLYNLKPITHEYQLEYLASLLKSDLLNWVAFKSFTEYKKLFPQFNQTTVSSIPIRRIAFLTSKTERNRLLKTVKKLYETTLTTGSFNPILEFVNECLRVKHIPDPSLVAEHNNNPFNKDFQIREDVVEQADVVYDLLAHLARQIIDYNKQKDLEVAGFLNYLKREIGTSVDELAGKSKICEYFDFDFEELLATLKKNSKKLLVDPNRRDFQERLKAEFDASVSKLKPVIRRIELTDKLIDRIVYSLYGLTEEEIEIVESSFRWRTSSKNKETEELN